ncbi:MAG: cysteine desulfurase family protein [Acidobacteriota bacterium]
MATDLSRPEDRAYFDHNATSPPDPRVVEAMLPHLGVLHGNPSSVHAVGQAARAAVERARRQVAELLGGSAPEVLFTSSGTEANNAVVRAAAAGGGRLVVSSLEHPSIRVQAEELAGQDIDVVSVTPGPDGIVSADRLLDAVNEDTRLVALMLANNELGTLQPVAEVGRRLRDRGVPLLCDAVQAVGKVAVDVHELHVDYLTLGGHKFHGPIGAAALWVRGGAPFEALLVGGGQERHRRASTENVPAIVGLGVASEIAANELAERRRHLQELRDRFEQRVTALAGVTIHCAGSPRLPHTSHVAFEGVDAQTLLIRLDLRGFAVSTGAACASGVVEPSATLLAMGIDAKEALASLRISFGLTNTPAEIDAFLEVLQEEVAKLRHTAEVPV